METILKKVGHIALLCLAIAATFFGTFKVAEYIVFEFLMSPRNDEYLLYVVLAMGCASIVPLHIMLRKIVALVDEISEIKPAPSEQTSTASSTSRPKGVFVGGKFVKVDDVEDVTPKNGGAAPTSQTPQSSNNKTWRDWAEKAQETAGKWADTAWEKTAPWAKAHGEGVIRHAEQKPLIFWGGGLIVAALLFASKSVTLFACLILAAIACFVAHKNKAAVGEALSKLGPVSVACILVVVGGMLTYDEVEAGLVLILMGCALLGALASYHVYKQSGSYSKGLGTAGACMLLVSFVFFKIGLPGYAFLIGMSGIVAIAIAGLMAKFLPEKPSKAKSKEELEAAIAKEKDAAAKAVLEIKLKMVLAETARTQAKAAAEKELADIRANIAQATTVIEKARLEAQLSEALRQEQNIDKIPETIEKLAKAGASQEQINRAIDALLPKRGQQQRKKK